MKLTDLAILDWVLVNNTPHRIQAIESRWIETPGGTRIKEYWAERIES